MKVRINLHDAVDDLAPAPPPCFFNKLHWIEYLKSAAASQNNKGEQKVILVRDCEPVFNFGYNICVDCTQIKSVEMMARGQCNPDFLKALA